MGHGGVCGVGEGAGEEGDEVGFGEGLEGVDAAAGEEGGVDLEGGVFRGGADEADGAAFDVGRKASCWALLKRWISSTKRMVREPRWEAFSASTMTCLISFMPERTAENSMKVAWVRRAMILARVVLPTPGGPQKIMEAGSSFSMARRRGLPGPRRCCWPA